MCVCAVFATPMLRITHNILQHVLQYIEHNQLLFFSQSEPAGQHSVSGVCTSHTMSGVSSRHNEASCLVS